MSVFEERDLTCPTCGTIRRASVALSLNGERSPEYRDEIIAGTFQSFECECCGQRFVAEGPLIYIDFASRQWIGCYPAGWEPRWAELEREPQESLRRNLQERAPPIAKGMSDGFEVRAVFGFAALREKLLCFEHHIDDRVLEVLKLDLMRSSELSFEPDARPRLVAAEFDRLIFEAESGDDRLRFGIARSRVDQIHNEPVWTESIDSVGGGPYVDIGRLMMGE